MGGGLISPLKRRYDSVNFTLEGVSGSLPSGGVDFGMPEYADDDPYRSGEDPTDTRDQGGVDPTAGEEDKATRADPFDYGTTSLGRRYPRDKCGHRIIPGSRRPEGAPPNSCKNLSKKDKSELTKVSTAVDPGAAASSSRMAIQPVRFGIVNAYMINGLRCSNLTLPFNVG